MKQRKPLERKTPLKRTTPLNSSSTLSRGKQLKTKKTFQASPAQREKRDLAPHCVVCGTERDEYTPVDPAHVVSRALGGCDAAECTVSACRECHRLYDDGRLDLLPFLEPTHRVEQAHAVLHLGLIGALQRVTGQRWRPE